MQPPPEELGLTLIQSGRFDEALAFIDTLPAGEVRTHELALVYHALGRRQEADAALQELLPHWIKRKSPFLKALHPDPRWSAWEAPGQ